MIAMALSTINSSILYLKAKDLTPGKPESLFELGYILMKRKSIFLISSILVVNSLGLCMVYFIIFGSTIGGIIAALAEGSTFVVNDYITGEVFMYQRTMYILILAAALFPVIIQKELQELHIVSMGLFGAILTFIFILFL
jgi:amino acid permease